MADKQIKVEINNSEMIERLPLEHPLPKEIQDMTKDDTVCKYCGISYFIHHEVKELQDKVKSLEQDLIDYQATIAREQTLKDEIKSIKEKLTQSQQLVKSKDDMILKQKSSLSKQTKEIQNLNETKSQLQDQLHKEFIQNSMLRKQNSNVMSRLPDLMAVVKRQRSELTNIHTFVSQRSKLVKETMATLNANIVRVCERELSEKQSSEKRLSSLEEEIKDMREVNSSLKLLLKDNEANGSRLEDMEVELVNSKDHCQHLRTEVSKLRNDVDSAASRCRTTESEAAQIKEQLRRKAQEVDDLREQQRKKDLVSEQMFSKYQLELKQKSEELRLASIEVKKSKQKMVDQHRIEEEIQRRAEETKNESEGIRVTLRKMKEECKALKEERELMINSHQNRIEQLRESFKQKLREADKWPERMSEESRKEKERHTNELKNLEEKLRQAFQMEIDIEKNRCEELIQKYKDEVKDNDEKLKNELKSVCGKHKLEVNHLRRQADEAKNSVNEIETDFKDEISSLKNIINNLQDRLAHVDRYSDGSLAQLRAELREAEDDLNSVKQENQKLEGKIKDSKEEVLFLQDTVRKECEERFDLTEALSQAREQLLSYQGHPASRSPGSRSSLSRPSSSSRSSSSSRPNSRPYSSSVSQSKDMDISERKSANGALTLGAQFSPGLSATVSTSSVNIDFNSPNRKKKTGSSKGGSMRDSRQRIAAAIGRK